MSFMINYSTEYNQSYAINSYQSTVTSYIIKKQVSEKEVGEEVEEHIVGSTWSPHPTCADYKTHVTKAHNDSLNILLMSEWRFV